MDDASAERWAGVGGVIKRGHRRGHGDGLGHTPGMGRQQHVPGERVARGNTSDVWAWAPGQVVKVLHPSVPAHWATLEADITQRVHAAGLPVPATEGVVDVDGRPGIVFERIEGVSMWARMKASPHELPKLMEELVELQLDLHTRTDIGGLPRLVTRLGRKIDQAQLLSREDRAGAHELLEGLPAGSSLCHGDMHPANLLRSDRGWVIIDWFDAALGHPMADMARSSLLMRPPTSTSVFDKHLAGATANVLDRLHRAYRTTLQRRGLIDDAAFEAWQAVLAVARMSEPVVTTDLVGIWRAWQTGTRAEV